MNHCIDYALVETSLGTLIVAATPRGVCRIAFGASEAELASLLPSATLQRDDAKLAPFAAAIADYVEGRATSLDLPLDVRGSEFQRRVWDALVAIQRGATRSYADVARSIGMPRAARAVANACGANPVALAIPCHRVVASGGGLGGYRWGTWRKRALLARESADYGVAFDTAASASSGIRAMRISERCSMPKNHGQSRSMRLV
jgi:AraC family transcriptional regulator, regulatory protein of adaptative response / methylated-DNA-[protein]-cysteine methyltransferase